LEIGDGSCWTCPEYTLATSANSRYRCYELINRGQATCGDKDGDGAGTSAVTDSDCGPGFVYNASKSMAACAGAVCDAARVDRGSCCNALPATCGDKDGLGSPMKRTITQATLSSSHPGYPASKCIDGNTLGTTSSMCHSSDTPSKAWINLDLGSAVSVALVKIYNRNTNMDRFGEHVIETSADNSTWTTCGTYTLPATYGPHEESCAVASARYVRLRMTHDGVLNLGEVEVYSTGIPVSDADCGAGFVYNASKSTAACAGVVCDASGVDRDTCCVAQVRLYKCDVWSRMILHQEVNECK
jgi:hypothetical protein